MPLKSPSNAYALVPQLSTLLSLLHGILYTDIQCPSPSTLLSSTIHEIHNCRVLAAPRPLSPRIARLAAGARTSGFGPGRISPCIVIVFGDSCVL